MAASSGGRGTFNGFELVHGLFFFYYSGACLVGEGQGKKTKIGRDGGLKGCVGRGFARGGSWKAGTSPNVGVSRYVV